MKRSLLALMLLVGSTFATLSAEATSICSTPACGKIVCAVGCQQKEVNGVCVVNRCVGGQAIMSEMSPTPDSSDLGLDSAVAVAGHCVSCAGGCCAAGHSFLSAERACKNRCGSFGCFTRCN